MNTTDNTRSPTPKRAPRCAVAPSAWLCDRNRKPLAVRCVAAASSRGCLRRNARSRSVTTAGTSFRAAAETASRPNVPDRPSRPTPKHQPRREHRRRPASRPSRRNATTQLPTATADSRLGAEAPPPSPTTHDRRTTRRRSAVLPNGRCSSLVRAPKHPRADRAAQRHHRRKGCRNSTYSDGHRRGDARDA